MKSKESTIQRKAKQTTVELLQRRIEDSGYKIKSIEEGKEVRK